MCVHVPSIWDRHVCLDDGALLVAGMHVAKTLECYLRAFPAGRIAKD